MSDASAACPCTCTDQEGMTLRCSLPYPDHLHKGIRHHDPEWHMDWMLETDSALPPYECTYSRTGYADGVYVNPAPRACSVCEPA